jgi:hypothetical protein
LEMPFASTLPKRATFFVYFYCATDANSKRNAEGVPRTGSWNTILCHTRCYNAAITPSRIRYSLRVLMRCSPTGASSDATKTTSLPFADCFPNSGMRTTSHTGIDRTLREGLVDACSSSSRIQIARRASTWRGSSLIFAILSTDLSLRIEYVHLSDTPQRCYGPRASPVVRPGDG